MSTTIRRQALNLGQQRWLAYAAAATATATGATCAEGEVHYSGPANLVFNTKERSSIASKKRHLPLTGGASLSFQQLDSFAGVPGVNDSVGVVGAKTNSFRGYYGALFAEGYFASRLVAGSVISAGPFVGRTSGNPRRSIFGYLENRYGIGQFTAPGEAFVGFRFDVGNGPQYGWARLKLRAGNKGSFLVVDYAWADPGEQLKTGQKRDHAAPLPAQGSLGALALGAAGLIAWRRSKSHPGLR